MSKVVKKIPGVKNVTKIFDKIVPNELKPFAAPIAAYYLGPMALKGLGGAGLTGVKGFLARAAASGVTSAGTQALMGEDVSKSSTLLSALSGGLGAGYGPDVGAQTADGIRAAKVAGVTPAGETIRAGQLAGMDLEAANALGLTSPGITGQAQNIALEAAAKASGALTPTTGKGIAKLVGGTGLAASAEKNYELMQKELDEYNASLGQQGIEDLGERRDLIRRYMANAGFDESQVNDALTRYGYLANGGRVGYEMGGSVEKTPNEIFIEMYQQGKYDTLRGAVEDANRYQRGETTNYEKLTGRKPFQEGGDVSYTDLGRSGVIYRDPQGNPISKEEFLSQTDEMEGIPSIRMKDKELTREDVLQAYADSDTAIKLLEKMVREGKVSQADYDRMMRIERDMGELENLPYSKYADKEELEQAEKDMMQRDQRITDLDQELYRILENPKDIEKMLKKRQGMKDGGIMNSKEGLKVDTMGDLSKEDIIKIKQMKEILQDRILKDKPGSASDIIELLNPFDDKPADVRSGVGRAYEYKTEVEDLMNKMIATKDKPEERSNFLKRFEEKYDTNISIGMKDGGIMNLKGKEMDLRGGGFVPIGRKEKADDVPARLSKNEFVFTADAVKGAGDGDINKGVKKMYNTMRMLEGKLA